MEQERKITERNRCRETNRYTNRDRQTKTERQTDTKIKYVSDDRIHKSTTQTKHSTNTVKYKSHTNNSHQRYINMRFLSLTGEKYASIEGIGNEEKRKEYKVG